MAGLFLAAAAFLVFFAGPARAGFIAPDLRRPFRLRKDRELTVTLRFFVAAAGLFFPALLPDG